MKKKELFGYDYSRKEGIKLLLYLFVGGTAALVEWALFYIFFYHLFADRELSLPWLTNIATAAAFGLSTLYHYFLGTILVFDSGSRFSRGKELSLVFLVSVLGLGFNLILMYFFVSLLAWPPLFSKIGASAIVVAWNYLSRKRFIFRS